MFPSRLKQSPRILGLTLLITFISGANFFSVLLFWPTQAFNVYGQDPIGVGVRGLPIGFSILSGAVLVLFLLSSLKGYNRELMIVSSIIMTAGKCCALVPVFRRIEMTNPKIPGVGALASLKADTLYRAWGLLVLAGLGIGGIVVPASIMTTIICPDVRRILSYSLSHSFPLSSAPFIPLTPSQDLIATVAALTLAIRVIGGSIGYTTYYNVFLSKFIPNAIYYIGGAMELELGITNPEAIETAIALTGASLLEEIKLIPGIAGNDTAWEIVVGAGQIAYAESYRYVDFRTKTSHARPLFKLRDMIREPKALGFFSGCVNVRTFALEE